MTVKNPKPVVSADASSLVVVFAEMLYQELRDAGDKETAAAVWRAVESFIDAAAPDA